MGEERLKTAQMEVVLSKGGETWNGSSEGGREKRRGTRGNTRSMTQERRGGIVGERP